MKKILLVFLLCFFGDLFCYGQNSSLSTVKGWHKTLSNSKMDTVKIGAYLKLSNYHFDRSLEVASPKSKDSAIYYAQKALGLSEQLKDQMYLGSSYIALSNAMRRDKQASMALENANKALTILTKEPNKKELAKAYLAKGSATLEMNSNQGAGFSAEFLDNYEKARQIYSDLGAVQEQADVLKNIAYFHMGQGKMQKGQDELKECLRLYKSIGFKPVQSVYSLLGVTYCQLGNFKDALENGLTSVKIAEELDPDSMETATIYNYLAVSYNTMKSPEKAFEYSNKAYAISKKYKNISLSVMLENNMVKLLMDLNRNKEALVLLNKMERYSNQPLSARVMIIGRSLKAYTSLKNYSKAANYAKLANDILASNNSMDYFNTLLYPALIKYYWSTKNYELTRKYADKYKAISEKNKNLKDLGEIHRVLFQVDSVQSNFASAVRNLELERKYNDSLFSETKNKQLAELQVKYDTDKKDKDLIIKSQANALLQKQSQLLNTQYNQEKNFRNASLVGFALLLFISGLLYFGYRVKKRTNKVLVQQKEEINKKNSQLEKLVDEKEWLLKEVHHRVKNNLQMVISLLNTQCHYLKDMVAVDAIRDSQNRIQSMSLIHKKLYQSDNIVSINLQTYVGELIECFKVSFNTGNRIRFELMAVPIELDSAQAIPLGLILNEVLTNSIKHAFPDDREGIIWVSIIKNDAEHFTLSIKDNGVGLSKQDIKTNFSSLGMNLIYGLSEDIGAELDIKSNNGMEFILKCSLHRKLLFELAEMSKESA